MCPTLYSKRDPTDSPCMNFCVSSFREFQILIIQDLTFWNLKKGLIHVQICPAGISSNGTWLALHDFVCPCDTSSLQAALVRTLLLGVIQGAGHCLWSPTGIRSDWGTTYLLWYLPGWSDLAGLLCFRLLWLNNAISQEPRSVPSLWQCLPSGMWWPLTSGCPPPHSADVSKDHETGLIPKWGWLKPHFNLDCFPLSPSGKDIFVLWLCIIDI